MPLRRVALLGLSILGSTLFSAPARAQDDGGDVQVHDFDANGQVTPETRPKTKYVTYLNPGPMISLLGGTPNGFAYGAEVSVMHFRQRLDWVSPGYGGFAQFQLFEGTKPKFALGGQIALGPAGVELGVAYRNASDGFGSTLGGQIGFFVSMGYVVVGVRDVVPLVSFAGAGTAFDNESSFFLAVKLPFVISGDDPTGLAIGPKR